MSQANYVQAGEMIDYRPPAAVRAGDVVVLGERVLVAKLDIEAGRQGALATAGAFDVVKAAVAIGAGDAVFWNPDGTPVGGSGTGAATTDPTDAFYMGYAVAAAMVNALTVRVLLGATNTAGPQGSRIVWDEVPEDLGGNLWQLAQTPAPGKLMLFRNGLLQREGPSNDFVLSGRDIAFNAGNEPQPGDILSATYLPA
jgi:predicted RecA/RadA family phage recombinase